MLRSEDSKNSFVFPPPFKRCYIASASVIEKLLALVVVYESGVTLMSSSLE